MSKQYFDSLDSLINNTSIAKKISRYQNPKDSLLNTSITKKKSIRKKTANTLGRKTRKKSNKTIFKIDIPKRNVLTDEIKQKELFFTHPCLIYSKLKQEFGMDINDDTIEHLDEIIPKVELDTTTSTFIYGKHTCKIDFKAPINSGTYGNIYKAKFNGKNIAVKVLKTFDAKEFFSETIIHNELYCGLLPLHESKKRLIAKIPEILFTVKLNVNGKVEYAIGIEELHGSGKSFIKKQPSSKDIIHCILSVSTLLDILQSTFSFMHRDLHLGNVMYKNDNWYIIDFGMSTMKYNKKWLNYKTGMYDECPERDLNASHDLRMFLTAFQESMNIGNYKYQHINYVLTIILFRLSNRPYYTTIRKRTEPLFWNTYDTLLKWNDVFYLPLKINEIFSYTLQYVDDKILSKQFQIGIYIKLGFDRKKNIIKDWQSKTWLQRKSLEQLRYISYKSIQMSKQQK